MLLPTFNLSEQQGIILLITDTLPSPASFLLHKSLASHFKSSSSSSSTTPRQKNVSKKATIVSVSEDFAKWKGVAARSNFNFNHHVDSGRITFVDALSLVQPCPSDSPLPLLRPLLDSINKSISNNNGMVDQLVILDDISTLEWIGFSLLDVSRFIRALVAACRREKATLIIRHHLTLDSSEIDDLFRCLIQLCSYHLEVRSLASGRSAAVSGEVALHAGPSTRHTVDRVKLIPRSEALQYRLTDTGAVFFDRGTGTAVL